ncbi:MAG: ModD protein [Treponema sp.]|jgi:molybdenum transport protein|nr:ModD protein [Treponema sp.]
MIYYPDALVDQWIADDVAQGDLTTRILGLGDIKGHIVFSLKKAGRASGIDAAEKLLRKLGLEITDRAEDGIDLPDMGVLISAEGKASALFMSWKVAQNVLEWSCGVAEYTARMVKAARSKNPNIQVSTTRKNIPGTKTLALNAVLNGGGIIHRGGASETILLFANHRAFLDFDNSAEAWKKVVDKLKAEAPEKKIIVEAETMDEVKAVITSQPDIIQLDKVSPADIKKAVDLAQGRCLISAAGGVTADNAADYAEAGAGLLVTSTPYYAKPSDVKVKLGY